MIALAAHPVPASVQQPANGARQDLSWALDDELLPRARQARTEAATMRAQAAADDEKVAQAETDKQAQANEQAGLQAAIPTQSGSQKKLSQSRMAELQARIDQDERTGVRLSAEAKADRANAAVKEAFAAAAEAEAGSRAAEAGQLLPQDSDLSGVADVKLRQARAVWKKRLDRAPKQLAAIDQQMDKVQDQDGRATLLYRASDVRAAKDAAQQQIELIDQELGYRKDAKADEAVQAEEMARTAARANATETPMEAETLTTARSAALDRKLAEIAEERDREAAVVEATHASWWLWFRVAAAVAVFALLAGIVVVAVRRG